MTSPNFYGRLPGYDAAIPKENGNLYVDGQVDDVRFEMARDGSSGRVYVQNDDGTQTDLTTQVEKIHILGDEFRYVMQFTADAEVQFDDHTMKPDGEGDVVTLSWDPEAVNFRHEIWFFEGSETFDQIVSDNPTFSQYINDTKDSIKRGGSTGGSSGGKDLNNMNTYSTDRDAHIDVVGYGDIFTRVTDETPFRNLSTSNMSEIDVRIGIERDVIWK